MKRLLIQGSFLFLILFGLVACFIFTNTYQYRPVAQLEEPGKSEIHLADSLSIVPYISLDAGPRILVVLRVEHLADSIFFDSLDVSLAGKDRPNELVSCSRLLVYKDSIDWVYENDYLVLAASFNELPLHYKTASVKRRQNTFMFHFLPGRLDSKYYSCKISGTASYHAQTIKFSKEVSVKIVRKWLPIQMMT